MTIVYFLKELGSKIIIDNKNNDLVVLSESLGNCFLLNLFLTNCLDF